MSWRTIVTCCLTVMTARRPRRHYRVLPLGVTTETFLIGICLDIINYVTTNFVSCVLSAVVFKD